MFESSNPTSKSTQDFSQKLIPETNSSEKIIVVKIGGSSLGVHDTTIKDIISLNEKGFTSPVIKELTPDLSKMWFAQDGTDYVANLSSTGIDVSNKVDELATSTCIPAP